jgi:transcription elongation GreA/GreB family factor
MVKRDLITQAGWDKISAELNKLLKEERPRDRQAAQVSAGAP